MLSKKTKTECTGSTFIVRFVDTEGGDWRGCIHHIQSGEIMWFESSIEVIRFMDDVASWVKRAS